MSLLKILIIFLTVSLLFLSLVPQFNQPTFAWHDPNIKNKCQFISINPAAIIPPGGSVLSNHTEFEYTIHINEDGTYKAYLRRAILILGEIGFDDLKPDAKGLIQFKSKPDGNSSVYGKGSHNIEVERKGASGAPCVVQYTISSQEDVKEVQCNISVNPGTPNPQTQVTYSGTIKPDGLYRFKFPSLTVKLNNEKGYFPKDGFRPDAKHEFSQNLGLIDEGDYQVALQKKLPQFFPDPQGGGYYLDMWKDIPSSSCNISNLVVVPTSQNPKPSSGPVPAGSGAPSITTPNPCDPNDPAYDAKKCASGGGEQCGTDKNPAIATAIGCIHTNPAALVKDVLTFAVGIGGGLAFLMMLLGAFQMITSAGNPETLQAGKERFTSAIIGLLFIIFTVLLLQIIGVGILAIPGFTK